MKLAEYQSATSTSCRHTANLSLRPIEANGTLQLRSFGPFLPSDISKLSSLLPIEKEPPAICSAVTCCLESLVARSHKFLNHRVNF